MELFHPSSTLSARMPRRFVLAWQDSPLKGIISRLMSGITRASPLLCIVSHADLLASSWNNELSGGTVCGFSTRKLLQRSLPLSVMPRLDAACL